MKPSCPDIRYDDGRLARQLAALAHPARLQILRWIAHRDLCHCKDVVEAMPLAQSTVSQHLRVLADAGLIHFERAGARSRYRLDQTALAELGDALGAFAARCCNSSSADKRNSLHV